MARKPNRNISLPLPTDHGLSEITLEFRREERARLQYNKPGPSEKLGGWQTLENLLIDQTDSDLKCRLTGDQQNQLREYCQHQDTGGGPNGRVRGACIPALRRQGIELLPEFSSQYVRKIPHDDPRLIVNVKKNAD